MPSFHRLLTDAVRLAGRTNEIVETAIRAVLKERRSDELGSASAAVEAAVVEAIDQAGQSWSVTVSSASLVIAVDA